MSLKESFVAKFEIQLKSDQEFITLQSLLKITDIISTGGMVKAYLAENEVLVNGELEDRRGRKLYPGDEIKVEGRTFVIKTP